LVSGMDSSRDASPAGGHPPTAPAPARTSGRAKSDFETLITVREYVHKNVDIS
jgi:hypothetical protein